MAFVPGINDLQGGGVVNSLQRFNPNQQQAFAQQLQQGQQGLNQNFNFAPIRQKYEEEFSKKTVPGLAERFSAMGGSPGGSSGFAGALGEASTGLATNLAALEQQFNQQQFNNSMQQLQLGLTPQTEQSVSPGAYQGFLGGLASATPQLAELAGKYFLGGKGGGLTQAAQAAAPSVASNIIQSGVGSAAGAALPAAAAGGSGLLAGLGTAAAAAAPFALPVAGAAAVIALPFLLSYLLED